MGQMEDLVKGQGIESLDKKFSTLGCSSEHQQSLNLVRFVDLAYKTIVPRACLDVIDDAF